MMKYLTKEVRIGIAGIIALCILVYGINYLKGIHMFKPTNYFYVKFHNINGLTKSSPVFADGFRVGIVCLIVGIYLLLYCQGLINFQFAWKLVVPVIFVLIGLKMIFKDTFNKKKPRQNIYDNQLYTGGNYDVTFNGLILDLSKAYLNEKTNITISTLFGGVDLYLPDDVNIQIQSSNFLGGVDLHKRENKIENTKVIYLNARCIFGGINIK